MTVFIKKTFEIVSYVTGQSGVQVQIFFFTCFVVYIVYPWNKRRRIIQKEISDVFEFFFKHVCFCAAAVCASWVGGEKTNGCFVFVVCGWA